MLTAPKNNRGQWSETRPIIMYIPRAQRTVLRQINKSISGILPSQSVLREITSKRGIHNWQFILFLYICTNPVIINLEDWKILAIDELVMTNQQVNFWYSSLSVSVGRNHIQEGHPQMTLRSTLFPYICTNPVIINLGNWKILWEWWAGLPYTKSTSQFLVSVDRKYTQESIHKWQSLNC